MDSASPLRQTLRLCVGGDDDDSGSHGQPPEYLLVGSERDAPKVNRVSLPPLPPPPRRYEQQHAPSQQREEQLLRLLQAKMGVEARLLHEAASEPEEGALEEPALPVNGEPNDDECVTPRGCMVGESDSHFSTLTATPPQGAWDATVSPVATPPPPQRQTPVRQTRCCPTNPTKILDAPDMVGGANQLLSWGARELVVPLGSVVYLRNTATEAVGALTEVPDQVASARFSDTVGHHLALGYGNAASVLDISRPDDDDLFVAQMQAGVAALAFQGPMLTCCCVSGAVLLYDIRTRRPVACSSHCSPVTAAQWSPDGCMTLATSCLDGTAKLWCSRQRRLLSSFPHTSPVADLSWSPDSRHLCTVAEDTLTVYNVLNSARPVQVLPLSAAAHSVLWGEDDLAVGHGAALPNAHEPSSLANSVSLWRPTAGGAGDLLFQAALKGHCEPVAHMTVSPDKRLLVTASSDESVRFWELGQPKPRPSTVYRTSAFDSFYQIR